MKIKEILNQAKSSIQIIGVAGIAKDLHRLLTDDSYAKSLKGLKISILCESDNFLFSQSVFTDTDIARNRISFTKLKFQRDLISNKVPEIRKESNLLALDIQITYLNIPLRIIKVDDDIYSNTWLTDFKDEYILTEYKSESHSHQVAYLEAFFHQKIGLKYSSPYLDSKGKRIETIELFDKERVRRGIYPRNSFYDTDYYKLVVWVFIFDRNGKLLIHKRSENAKDNQGMWDKSVGGHMDYEEDIDTYKTVTREVIEELYTDETKESNFIRVKDENMIYLGDWKPQKRSDYIKYEINKYSKEWTYFRLPEYEQAESPRFLPDGSTRSNNVIADVYLFVASKEINKKAMDNFQNSSFQFIDLADLKTAISKRDKGEKLEREFGFKTMEPKFSPDLRYTFKGSLRSTLENFSEFVEFYIDDK